MHLALKSSADIAHCTYRTISTQWGLEVCIFLWRDQAVRSETPAPDLAALADNTAPVALPCVGSGKLEEAPTSFFVPGRAPEAGHGDGPRAEGRVAPRTHEALRSQR
jgi:hypothetical protein